MDDCYRLISFEDLSSHLVVEILKLSRLSASNLVSLELTSKTFGGGRGLHPYEIRPLVDYAAFQLRKSSPVYARLTQTAQKELHERCGGKSKQVLRFLQAVEQSSDMVETSAVWVVPLVKALKPHNVCLLPKLISHIQLGVIHVSANQNHTAFVMQSREVFTCRDNSSFGCGHSDTSGPIFRPRLVEALKGVPCKQVATRFNFTAFLTKQGHVYTCGTNTHGQLGHDDFIDGSTPRTIELLEGVGSVVQIACGPSYALAVMEDGTVYSLAQLLIRLSAMESCKTSCTHVRFRHLGETAFTFYVSAGDAHAVALDSNGYVYTWGNGCWGALVMDRRIIRLLRKS